MILAGDIGGTKTVLAICKESPDGPVFVREERYASADYDSLEAIVREFLAAEKGVDLRAGCFGVAGAVVGGRSQATNLPWVMEESSLAVVSGTSRFKLLNDLEAMSLGMLTLGREDLAVLNPGKHEPKRGNVVVIAAGTGLGEAMLYFDGTRHHPMASEGGHADFAPQTDLQLDLLRYLRDKFGGHVSWERVLSGPGLYNVYCFLRDTGIEEEPRWLAEELAEGDPNVSITRVGLEGKAALCIRALELFSNLYGAEAGNMALRSMAIGGVYVGGGIAPKLRSALENGSFMTGFTDKGRFRDFLSRVPVSICLNPRTPLLGAAHHALNL